MDFRSGVWCEIYAQCVNSTGSVKWTFNGVAICTASYAQANPQICSDGLGGAIITLFDDRIYQMDIYAQRVDSSGGVKWTANGTAICTASHFQHDPQICPDRQGGAIVAWIDARSGTYDAYIYAQRINSTGSVKWTANGTAICTASKDQDDPQICSDGQGGAIVAWKDKRSGAWDIYVQNVKNDATIPSSSSSGVDGGGGGGSSSGGGGTVKKSDTNVETVNHFFIYLIVLLVILGIASLSVSSFLLARKRSSAKSLELQVASLESESNKLFNFTEKEKLQLNQIEIPQPIIADLKESSFIILKDFAEVMNNLMEKGIEAKIQGNHLEALIIWNIINTKIKDLKLEIDQSKISIPQSILMSMGLEYQIEKIEKMIRKTSEEEKEINVRDFKATALKPMHFYKFNFI